MTQRYVHSLPIQVFNMKGKKSQFGGRKVVGQATVITHLAQKVGGRGSVANCS